MINKKEQLKLITKTLLDSRNPAYSLRPETLELLELLNGFSPLPPDPVGDIADGETATAEGVAISPRMAAMCGQDYMRTIRFLRGIHAAIIDVLEGSPERPVRIFYAGCGPYALLAVPLMSMFSSAETQFTLLDLHAESIASAKSIVEKLGFREHVEDFVETDVLHYHLPNAPPLPDVIVFEVMRACLEEEPQVAIARHLLPQAPNAIAIPNEVNVVLLLVDTALEFNRNNEQVIERNRVPIAPVFTLNRESLESWRELAGEHLIAAEVCLPADMERHLSPMLFTHIQIHKHHELKDYESGLTCPRALTQPINPGDTLRFHYELGAHPRLCCKVSSATDTSPGSQ